MKDNIMRRVHGTARALEIMIMTQPRILTCDEIDAVVAQAREERAEAMRSGAVNLGLVLKHFLADLCRTPARA
jgi:hypothetical protein